jgi:hypothetical protein
MMRLTNPLTRQRPALLIPAPARRLSWVSAVALLSLGAALGTATLDRGIASLPAYQGTLPLGILPPGPYAVLLLTAGAGLLVDLSGHVRDPRMRRALWGYGIFALWVVVVYSAEAVLFGTVRPFAALAGFTALACGATTAWWSDGV